MSSHAQRHASTLWRLEGTRAQLAAPHVGAVVDVTTPRRGLGDLVYCGAPIHGSLLGVDVDDAPSDAYVRDNDLVVAYHESVERPFSIQIYWTVDDARADGATIIDATVSIQTRQWEAYPRVAVRSALDGSEAIALDGEAALWRPTGEDWSYAETCPPHDFVRQASPGGAASPAWTFGDEFMERGVIRRLRLRGAFVPRAGDVEAVRRLRAELLAEQPPLTA